MTVADGCGGAPWVSHSDGAAEADDAGAVLRVWREDAGRTQTDVAGVLGTTQQHLSLIETG
ncbi:MAG: helix-turn-helix transcriptional regulator, partial [Pseudonocardiales bacterium]